MQKIFILLICATLVACGRVDNNDRKAASDSQDQVESTQKELKVDYIWSNESTYIYIQGIITNNTDQTYEYLQIVVTVHDADGNFLGTDSSYVSPTTLGPGEWSSFHCFIWDKTCPTETIKIEYRFEN